MKRISMQPKKGSRRALMIGAMTVAIGQLLLYLGTRTLEKELEQTLVFPFQTD
jgi:dipeptide/tripeptide permease